MSSTQQALPQLDTPLVQDSVGTTSDGKAVEIKGGIISIPWYRFLISLWNRTGAATGSIGIATGVMYIWGGDPSQVPEGLLICDGRQVSRTQFADLFGAIGVRYGAGDGSTTFNLPNMQDRVPVGASGSKIAGTTGGSNSLTLTEPELPVVNLNIIDPGHHHAQQVANNNVAGVVGTQGGTAANTTSIGQTDNATTGITASFGGGQAIDITPAYVAVTWVIQT